MFLKLMLISVVFLGIAFAGFAIKILLLKNGEFPETKIGHNKTMRKRKIFCVNTTQKIIDKGISKDQGVSFRGPTCDGC